MAVMVGCNTPPPVGHPLTEGDGLAHTTSPRPSPGGEGGDSPALKGTPSQRGTASLMLEGIDSLMWVEADSALKVMLEFAGSEAADSMGVFEGHYCQVLVGELLFKNYYKQSNREEVLKAVGYFDSVVNLHGADARGASLQRGAAVRERDAFLAARAHYINGVGYYEHDSLIEACTEYLCALRIMESHFGEDELVGKKARFMALTYNRLGDLFSAQFMQEPAIYCYKQALAYNRIAPTSPYGSSNILYRTGKQFDKLKVADSAAYYYEMAMELLPDRNNMIYRDIVSSRALSEFSFHGDAITALDSLKSMVAQASDEAERINRYMSIGGIYYTLDQYDSAKIYLEPVFEKDSYRAIVVAQPLHKIAMCEGDALKASQYALALAEEGATVANNQARVSQLNDLFQNYLQEKQEMALALERLEARRRNLWIGGVGALLAIVGLSVSIVTRRRHRKRLVAQEEKAQRRLDEASQRLSEASQRHDEAERVLQTKVEQAAQHTRELFQQRAADIYQSNSKDRLQRILEAVNDTYPQAVARLKAEHPELNETELNILLLNFLHFRIKEEADLLGLSENTVGKYRSNLGKTLGKDPISDWI